MKSIGHLCMVAMAFAAIPLFGDTPAELSRASRLNLIYQNPAPLVEAPRLLRPSTPGPDTFMMPAMVVKDYSLRMDDYSLLTQRGRIALAKKEYLSPVYQKVFGPLAWASALYFNPMMLINGTQPNDSEAMLLLKQDLRLRRMRLFDDWTRLSAPVSPWEARVIRDLRHATFLRDLIDTRLSLTLRQ